MYSLAYLLRQKTVTFSRRTISAIDICCVLYDDSLNTSVRLRANQHCLLVVSRSTCISVIEVSVWHSVLHWLISVDLQPVPCGKPVLWHSSDSNVVPLLHIYVACADHVEVTLSFLVSQWHMKNSFMLCSECSMNKIICQRQSIGCAVCSLWPCLQWSGCCDCQPCLSGRLQTWASCCWEQISSGEQSWNSVFHSQWFGIHTRLCSPNLHF